METTSTQLRATLSSLKILGLTTCIYFLIIHFNYSQAGSLDSTFDADGKQVTDINGGSDNGYDIAIQADGKIIVTGAAGSGSNDDVAVTRYNPDGTLDNTFDGDGKVLTNVTGGQDVGFAVAVQSDGKIVIAGYTFTGGYDILVLRYNSDGSLDNSFDTDGMLTTAVGFGEDRAYSVAIQNDGKIVVAGHSHNGTNFDVAVVRYNTDGSLDNTFDSDGKVTTAFGTNENGYSVQIQPDGKIVVAGNSFNGSWDFIAIRYNTNGSLDNSFNGTGIVTTDFGTSTYDIANALGIQADGKIVLAGYTYVASFTDFAVLRYNSDGTLDNTFDGDGKTITSLSSGNDDGFGLAIQTNGKIVVAGTSHIGVYGDFGVARYTTNGALDNTFDGDGMVNIAVDSLTDAGYSVAIQTDGKIVVGGFSAVANNDYSVARLIGDPVTFGIENIDENAISIYPNPADHFINIECGEWAENISYSIVNTLGAKLMNGNLPTSSASLDIQQLSPGFYWVILEHEGKMATKKLVVE